MRECKWYQILKVCNVANYGTLDLKMMNSAFEFNHKIIVNTFRIILETLRRRVRIIWMIIQGIMQVLGQKKSKRIEKRKEKTRKWKF